MSKSILQSITVLPDVPAIVQHAAALMIERIKSAVATRGKCTLALSGGTSVGGVFELLAADHSIDWQKVFLFWGDDRFVDLTNPYSSYKLASEKLFPNVPSLPKENVFPVPVKAATPTDGAKAYSQTIRDFFELKPGDWPVFDLALNGMGPDGHTASLFPHSPALDETTQLAVMNHAGLAPWVDRITLTFPVFNHARCVMFMVSGANKAHTLKAVLEGERNIHLHPAQGIQPANGELLWLVDPAAASLLTQKDIPHER